jgi:uncharacterized protein
MQTPCVRVCAVHPTLGLCVGCGRSLDEIGRWIGMSDAERVRVMAQLPQRLAAISSMNAANAPAAPATPAIA